MPNMIIAGSETLKKENGYAALLAKIKMTIDYLEKNEKPTLFLKKLFSRREMQFLSEEHTIYLNILFDDILEALSESDAERPALTVFRLFLRYNFNHEAVPKECVAEIEQYIKQHPEKATSYLEEILQYSGELDRKDMAFNKHAHSLREEIDQFVRLRMEKALPFEPFKVRRHANTIFPFMRLLVETEIFEEMDRPALCRTLSYIFRNEKGQQYSYKTVLNRYNFDGGANTDDVKALIDEVYDELDKKIRIRENRARRKKL
jgi:hypothetical protein